MQKGYKEVTMKDIVDNAELSKGAFYHYFDSKEKVFKGGFIVCLSFRHTYRRIDGCQTVSALD
jgi:AcrR family transcriptional regulator